jgi:hypothetical protein
MRTREGVKTLIQELEGDVEELQRVGEPNARARARIEGGATDILDYGALAYTIHNAYGILENCFLRMSKYFENTLPCYTWHKTLLERMALDIPEVRPAVLPDKELKQTLLELLRFRHKFRNLYGEDLDPQRTMETQAALEQVLRDFPEKAHGQFRARLEAIAEEL